MARTPNQPNQSHTASTATPMPVDPANQEPQEAGWRAFLRQFRPAIMLTLLLTLIVGIIYPLATTGVAQAVFPSQANGSLVCVNGKPIGSSLIGQYWTEAQYFQGRPSVTNNLAGTPAPYEADNSAGSNLGPTNSALIQTVQQRIAALKKENPDVPAGTPIPADLVEASASGLDPDISVAAAYYQIPRVAKARGMSQAALEQEVNQHIQGRFLGLFGEPVVNVLDLNLALDNVTPSSCH
jgi:potassium-transporting ATPase KdpC subunit